MASIHEIKKAKKSRDTAPLRELASTVLRNRSQFFGRCEPIAGKAAPATASLGKPKRKALFLYILGMN